MKRVYVACLHLFFLVNAVSAQTNPQLSKQIDSLAEADQKWRLILREPERLHLDPASYKTIEKKINAADSLNLPVVRKIFKQHGFPGYSLVGRKSSRNFWLLVQHQDKHATFCDSVILKMKEDVDKKNASAYDYAIMVDRVKLNAKQLQIYGTQVQINRDSTSYVPKPVFEPEKLNERRKSIGLSSIEEFIATKNSAELPTPKKK